MPFLRACGIPDALLPPSLTERAALWRSITASLRLLIVLDDAQNRQQIPHLLPAAAGSASIVTSWRRIPGRGGRGGRARPGQPRPRADHLPASRVQHGVRWWAVTGSVAVFQNPETALNPRHSVRHILGRAVTLLDDTAARADRAERVGDLARSVRLEPHHLDMRPTALSGGLKQRVAIARSFAGEPSLVLCDEPVSALDVSVQAAILNLLADLQTDRNVSYLFISHDMSVIRYIADRIGVLYLGQLVEIGTTDAVFAPPHHPYTEVLLSSVATLGDTDGRERIRLRDTQSGTGAPSAGCRFQNRCPRVLGDICRTEAPPWQQAEAGNRYRCHIPPERLHDQQTATESVA